MAAHGEHLQTKTSDPLPGRASSTRQPAIIALCAGRDERVNLGGKRVLKEARTVLRHSHRVRVQGAGRDASHFYFSQRVRRENADG